MAKTIEDVTPGPRSWKQTERTSEHYGLCPPRPQNGVGCSGNSTQHRKVFAAKELPGLTDVSTDPYRVVDIHSVLWGWDYMSIRFTLPTLDPFGVAIVASSSSSADTLLMR